ncbi:hypothetical protein [Streptomyces sp. NPDC000229]|uniref:hypothetical protein n=1 Tax=Streptomyces sp. NPDC000229 TaxID=3154247 RepID=UPI003318D626
MASPPRALKRHRASRAVGTLLAALALLVAGGVTGTTAAGATTSTCPSVDGQWAAPGPFAVSSASNGRGTTVFRPADLGTLGCTTHPVVLWNNGARSGLDRYAPC